MAYLFLKKTNSIFPLAQNSSLLELEFLLIQTPNSIQTIAPVRNMSPYYSQICLYHWSPVGDDAPPRTVGNI